MHNLGTKKKTNFRSLYQIGASGQLKLPFGDFELGKTNHHFSGLN
jgi:hypothetical protein